jgi:hypothetical protein
MSIFLFSIVMHHAEKKKKNTDNCLGFSRNITNIIISALDRVQNKAAKFAHHSGCSDR